MLVSDQALMNQFLPGHGAGICYHTVYQEYTVLTADRTDIITLLTNSDHMIKDMGTDSIEACSAIYYTNKL